jgi:hypothetical protein
MCVLPFRFTLVFFDLTTLHLSAWCPHVRACACVLRPPRFFCHFIHLFPSTVCKHTVESRQPLLTQTNH